MSNNTATIKTRKNLVSTRTITMTALLAAISYVLAFLEFPVPLSPSFARMDLSDLPALIGAFAFGPVTGVMIELIKNILQLLSTSTGGIGELANFLISFLVFLGFWLCVCSQRSGLCLTSPRLHARKVRQKRLPVSAPVHYPTAKAGRLSACPP